ncbi:MAG: HAD-IA family hydrolase [Gammaproteobacteria bacterium]
MKLNSSRKAILFDLDGTLLHTAPDFAHCLNQMLSKLEQPLVSVQSMKPWVSDGVRGMVKGAFNIDESDLSFTSKTAELLALYAKHLGDFTEFFPGMLEVLAWLDTQKIIWGVVTNKSFRFAAPLLAKFNLLKRAHCLVCGDTLATQKPDPAPIQYACQQLKLETKDCFYIGDSFSDAKASSGAGMPYILAEYGYIPPTADLKSWPIFKSITKPLDVLSLFSC